MRATYQQYILNFKQAAGTSRGILNEKETWFISIEKDGRRGVGECGLLKGLSIDYLPDYEEKIKWACENIQLGEFELWKALIKYPSIQFGIEMAFRSLESENPFLLFPSNFTKGKESIQINGLIWMGDFNFMKQQIEEKLLQGFRCIKLKIGAIDFDRELELLSHIRKYFSSEMVEIRVDANGAFLPNEALYKLNQLARFKLHSIEQPIPKNSIQLMRDLCSISPVPIALDEELIGVFSIKEKEELIEKISPHYLVLKPSFIGGFRGTKEWINLAKKHNIGWWITSALESNIGLNAIAQWTFLQTNSMPQGLGTGGLYTNNFECPLKISNGQLWCENYGNWEFNLF